MTDTAPTIPEHLLNRDTYGTLLARLMLAPSGHDHRSSLIEALGEVGNIWPDYVHDGVEITEITEDAVIAA